MDENEKMFRLLREELVLAKTLLKELQYRHLVRLTADLRKVANGHKGRMI